MRDVLNFSFEKIITHNVVNEESYVPSKNFFVSDKILVHFLQKEFSDEVWALMQAKLSKLGKVAATCMDELSMTADKNPPKLVKRDLFGRDLDKIVFHPAYKELLKIAVDAGVLGVKWDPAFKRDYPQYRHRMGFSLAFIYGMAESGLSCPLCMTDGAASVLEKYADPEDSDRILEHIYATDSEKLYTGSMFLTEKSAGSDVGACQVSAAHIEGKKYLLNGEKWFCSNANAEIKLVLARTDAGISGTAGLSLFLVENTVPFQGKNPMEVIRLKDKMGVRSMATAEIKFKDTRAKLIGSEGQGFKIMTEMINLSRLWNAVIATATFRRALIEAYQFLSFRMTFGRPAIEHALVRSKLYELASRYVADFYLTWKTIAILDQAESGQDDSLSILRVLTPLVKKQTAESAVYGVRECMELMGGLGYLEEGVLPKLMRDSHVLPIWEGTSNMMILDALRASMKGDGLQKLVEQTKESLLSKPSFEDESKEIDELWSRLGALQGMDEDMVAHNAKGIFERLTRYIQIGMLIRQEDKESVAWIGPTLDWLKASLCQQPPRMQEPIALDKIIKQLAWGF